MCDLKQYRDAGLIDELGKPTRFGGLPDSVLFTLTRGVEVDEPLEVADLIRIVQRLRPLVIADLPAAVMRQVREACQTTIEERRQQ